MKVIGVTGSFGTGKSTVSGFLKDLGAHVLDLDKISHGLLKEDENIKQQIVSYFGKQILDRSGLIDRKKLSKKVFVSKNELKHLCGVIHPAVEKVLKSNLDEIKRTDKDAIVVIDAPLLIEVDLIPLVDTVILVRTNLEVQIKRCKSKFKISQADVLKRVKSQMSLKEKERFADFIIDNSSSKQNTRLQTKKIFEIIN